MSVATEEFFSVMHYCCYLTGLGLPSLALTQYTSIDLANFRAFMRGGIFTNDIPLTPIEQID